MPRIDQIISTFRSVEDELRLHLLLDYARRLPEPPAALYADAAEDLGRVPECMTPVWVWVAVEGGRVRVYARVAEEAPTVQGLLSIIAHGYESATPEEVASMPLDLAARLGLSGVLRMNRAVGFNAVIQRIRREAQRLVPAEGRA